MFVSERYSHSLHVLSDTMPEIKIDPREFASVAKQKIMAWVNAKCVRVIIV